MNDTLKEIIRILEGGEPELQVAAAQVLGELRPTDPAVGRALVGCLDRGEAFLHRFVLEALAKIGTADAMRALVSRLSEGGGDLDMVTHLLGELGAPAHKPLSEAFAEAARDTRLRILGLLGRQVSREGLAVLQKALLEPELTRQAGRALVRQSEELNDAQRKSVKEGCNKLLSSKTLEIPSECLPEILVVLGRIDGTGARATLIKFSADSHPTTVREAALRGLVGVKLTPGQVQSLLAMLMDNGARTLEAPIMAVLESVDSWDSDSLPTFKKLLRSKRQELALFALRSLRCFHNPEVAKETMRFLDHANADFREAAAAALGENPAAVDPLLRVLQTEKDPNRARVYSEILARHRERFPVKQLKSLVEKVCKQLGAQDPMGEVRLQLLLEIDGHKAGELMVDKAVRLRRARRLGECLTILAHLARSAYLPDEGRYQMAVARLLLDENGTRNETPQAGDATMGYIAKLVRDGFPVLERLKKEAMVPPKAKLRVGSHFADAVGAERRFGTDLLHHVADKHSRDRVGEEARLMLRSEGL